MEAVDWICNNEINSYYEFKLHCYKERPEWVPLLRNRNNRAFFVTFTREIKRDKNKKYSRPIQEVLGELADAEAEYNKKQFDAMIDEMERQQAEYEASMFQK